MAAGRAGGGGGRERDWARAAANEASRVQRRGREEQEVREDARKEAALARAGSAGASDQAEGGIGVGSAEAVGGGAAPGVSTSGWAPAPAPAAELVMAARRVMVPVARRGRG